ncbi:DUF1419 domain-containing protein [Escherichia coli]|uniref:DUF1419 domain-containing protein n=1 Tax=Escherichia sp. E5028 TaxID=2044602 RepID=UPI00107F45D4|nr:DUF1419 domain-containing protein [Escherichia sp. E5028]ELP3932572.1 DUF1419 domain-containing protein [Escherichia coli]TGB52867.1 hypothetical protein CRT22_23970 [Escherichia sp. E5028]
MNTTTATVNTAYPTMYFYNPGDCYPQDIATIPADKINENTIPVADRYRGVYSGKSLEEYKAEYPLMLLLTLNEVDQRANEAAKQPVSEITPEVFRDMLEVLPPMNWCLIGPNSTFMLSEMYSGNVTDIFARIRVGKEELRYFRLRDLCTLKHDEIVERCKTYMQQ